MARHSASHTRMILSYVFDYVILIALGAIWGYIALLPPNFSRFSLNDITLQYPIADPETVTDGALIVYSVLLPSLVILAWGLGIDMVRYRSPLKDRLWEVNVGILGLALSVTLSNVITISLKGIVGRPRPDSIARCMPAPGSADATPYGLSTIDICTQTDIMILNEGFRSWPSGHSSAAFSGLFYLALYLAGKLSLLDNKGEVWKSIIVMTPVLGALSIAASRILDHRHHGTDVLTGSLLGVATSIMAYRLYYPALSDTVKQGKAYAFRVWGEMKVSPSLEAGTAADTRDDEELIGGDAFRRRGNGRGFTDDAGLTSSQRQDPFADDDNA
ncbi:phosphatidic acid phosphatase type 2/haloperoxidase [Lipomyces arxii]|uniref:phosphatidic acid phosphatase type 2/haloperoxidase n=1 Tax=Lipomyces arxii TaxID=56418 RepID=UPI0034CE7272